MIDNSLNERETLLYGQYALDEQLFDGKHDTRMRVIVYDKRVYYHKMIDGSTVEFRKLDGYELDS